MIQKGYIRIKEFCHDLNKPKKAKKRSDLNCNVVRLIYNADRGLKAKSRIVRVEGQAPVKDEPLVNSAYDYIGQVLEYLYENHGRCSIDNKGMDVIASVNYGPDFGDAYWEFNQDVMLFGPGDDFVYDHFVRLDVTAHELFHAITRFDTPLGRKHQSGAIFEHLGDVFAQLVVHWVNDLTVDKADWLSGKGLLIDAPELPLRNMLHPGESYEHPIIGKDVQVGHMDDYVTTTWDNGGVHINAGILNRAFSLFAIACGGYSYEKAGKIWYESLEHLKADTDFQSFAQITKSLVSEHYPEQENKLQEAWKEVGISI